MTNSIKGEEATKLKMLYFGCVCFLISMDSFRGFLEQVFAESSIIFAQNFQFCCVLAIAALGLTSLTSGSYAFLSRDSSKSKGSSSWHLSMKSVAALITLASLPSLTVAMSATATSSVAAAAATTAASSSNETGVHFFQTYLEPSLPVEYGDTLGQLDVMLSHCLAKLEEWNSLDFLVPYWQYMLDNYSEFTIFTVFSFLYHQIAHFGMVFVYCLLTCIPYFDKYRIQQKRNSWPQTLKCIKGVILQQFFVQLPMIMMSDYGLRQLGFTMELPLPKATTIMWKCMVMFVIEDFYFYCTHRLLHWKKIYKYIHKVHHEYTTPFPVAAEYSHPLETMILGLGSFIGPFFLTRHLLTLWVWIGIRMMESIEDHCGYNLPFSITNWIPFWAGAAHHDFHHEKFDVNYCSVFTFWDRVFGTDRMFREYQHERNKSSANTWTDLFDKVHLSGSNSAEEKASKIEKKIN